MHLGHGLHTGNTLLLVRTTVVSSRAGRCCSYGAVADLVQQPAVTDVRCTRLAHVHGRERHLRVQRTSARVAYALCQLIWRRCCRATRAVPLRNAADAVHLAKVGAPPCARAAVARWRPLEHQLPASHPKAAPCHSHHCRARRCCSGSQPIRGCCLCCGRPRRRGRCWRHRVPWARCGCLAGTGVSSRLRVQRKPACGLAACRSLVRRWHRRAHAALSFATFASSLRWSKTRLGKPLACPIGKCSG